MRINKVTGGFRPIMKKKKLHIKNYDREVTMMIFWGWDIIAADESEELYSFQLKHRSNNNLRVYITYYALQARHKDGKRTITLVIFRQGLLNDEWSELTYDIKLMDDSTGDVIEDVVYQATLQDMELFGESLVHYLNTI